jgi:hypothetical protein
MNLGGNIYTDRFTFWKNATCPGLFHSLSDDARLAKQARDRGRVETDYVERSAIAGQRLCLLANQAQAAGSTADAIIIAPTTSWSR